MRSQHPSTHSAGRVSTALRETLERELSGAHGRHHLAPARLPRGERAPTRHVARPLAPHAIFFTFCHGRDADLKTRPAPQPVSPAARAVDAASQRRERGGFRGPDSAREREPLRRRRYRSRADPVVSRPEQPGLGRGFKHAERAERVLEELGASEGPDARQVAGAPVLRGRESSKRRGEKGDAELARALNRPARPATRGWSTSRIDR